MFHSQGVVGTQGVGYFFFLLVLADDYYQSPLAHLESKQRELLKYAIVTPFWHVTLLYVVWKERASESSSSSSTVNFHSSQSTLTQGARHLF